jgi:hypothetical protein
MLGNSMNQNKGLKTRLLEKLRAGFVLLDEKFRSQGSGVRKGEFSGFVVRGLIISNKGLLSESIH